MAWLFLMSGLYLGWSLGATEATKLLGTAVDRRIVSRRMAALIASVAVICGAMLGGAAVTDTLGSLGQVNAIAGSSVVALAAGVAGTAMSRIGIPASIPQAIVGAILGWNVFTGTPTDHRTLWQVASGWVLSPILAATVAILLHGGMQYVRSRQRIHMLSLDTGVRRLLVVVGALAAFALGANNIAAIIGAFVPVAPLPDIDPGLGWHLSGRAQLVLLGALAIAVGLQVPSRRVRPTETDQLVTLPPALALTVVLAHTLVLLAFSSSHLQAVLHRAGLPSPPLVPVSSMQTLIGAVLGIALVRGRRGIHWGTLRRVAIGWVATPCLAGVASVVLLFLAQDLLGLAIVAPDDAVEVAQTSPRDSTGLRAAQSVAGLRP